MKYRSGLLLLLTSTSEFLGFHASNLGVFHDSIYGSSFRVVEGNWGAFPISFPGAIPNQLYHLESI